MSQRLGRLKEQVQELHRDVTTQRGGSYSSYAARAETCLREGLSLEELLNRRQTEMERIKKLFESTWNEHMRQVRIEQEVFQTQVREFLFSSSYSYILYLSYTFIINLYRMLCVCG